MSALQGDSTSGGVPAVTGKNTGGPGGNPSAVWGESANGEAIHGQTNSKAFAAIAGTALNTDSTICAVYGEHKGKGPAFYGTSAGGNGIEIRSVNGVGAEIISDHSTGVWVRAGGVGNHATGILIDHADAAGGYLILGRSGGTAPGTIAAEVFRVLANGDVQVRGVTLSSDENGKTKMSAVETREILEKVANLPLACWSYKSDSPQVRHIGPTSQDFNSAFGLNGDDTLHISSVDAHGVALAAIQGLNERLSTENERLRADYSNLERRIQALEAPRQP